MTDLVVRRMTLFRSMIRKLILAAGLLLAAALPAAAAPADAAASVLTVGMMPAVDAAPFYHALFSGMFTEEEVNVELILFTSGQERQTALQTGRIDGAMTDLVALITNRAGGLDLVGTLSTDGVFPLLSSTNSAFNKQSLTAGLMEISVTHYLLDAYLGRSDRLEKVYINDIPARLEAVASGKLDIGIFPEPFASIGELRGLEKTVFSHKEQHLLNLIAFSGRSLRDKHDAVSRFHKAYGRAAAEIAADPRLALTVLAQAIPNLPEAALPLITLPEYRRPGLPDDEFLRELIAWTEGITGKTYRLTPEELVDRSFIH